jgi:hypothetical protein
MTMMIGIIKSYNLKSRYGFDPKKRASKMYIKYRKKIADKVNSKKRIKLDSSDCRKVGGELSTN